jgi:CheY-like chemotaxis protein
MSTPEEAPAGRRVLVVEDNADSRWSRCFLLRRWGHQVEEAPDDPEGLRLALDWRPEAAILDIGLPGLDGYVEADDALRRPLQSW